MHRNTLLLIAGLGIFAALVFGVNLGRKLSPQPSANNQFTTPTVSQPTTAPLQNSSLLEYTNTTCGVSFQYPSQLTKLESADGSAIFSDPEKPDESLAVTCQKDIPRPPINTKQIDVFRLDATTSANLYHDTSAKDGTPVDKLIFTHPKTKLDVYLAGFPELMKLILPTLTLLP